MGRVWVRRWVGTGGLVAGGHAHGQGGVSMDVDVDGIGCKGLGSK